MRQKIQILDTTLRDGAQTPGISFSVQDKLSIVRVLDGLGVAYIEAGHPASNPKELDFFRQLKGIALEQSRVAAFCATRRKYMKPDEDEHLLSLLQAETPVVVIVGKAWKLHVDTVLHCSVQENLDMIAETVAWLKQHDREVIFDAEHFFDGYLDDPDFALETLRAARRAGADTVVLCDTNGGRFPEEITAAVREAVRVVDGSVGIHCHDDGGMATASTVMSVQAGVSHVQGTLFGLGERCGNAALSEVIPNLQGKLGFDCIPDLPALTRAVRHVAEIANVVLPGNAPFVGADAFTHKGGMHVDGVVKLPSTFEHIDPATVGNARRLLTSEMGGRAGILAHMRDLDPDASKDSPAMTAAIDLLRAREHEGYQYEGAEASLSLLLRRVNGTYTPFFELVHFKTIGEHNESEPATAIVKVRVGDRQEVTAAEGDGPVHALDRALRRALEVFYPRVGDIRLIDYKVRVLDTREATAARVRVLITSTDSKEVWTTVGVSADIIQASFQALADSVEYQLFRQQKQRKSYGTFSERSIPCE